MMHFRRSTSTASPTYWLLLQLSWILTTNSEFRQNLYQIKDSSSLKLETSGVYSTDSKLACAAQCLSSHGSDYFVYLDTSCTCAEVSTNSTSPGLPILGALYGVSHCDVTQGFRSYVLASGGSVCVKVSGVRDSYTSAKVTCAGFPDSRLFLADSREKLDLLELVSDINTLWVGLDDVDVEGEMRWSDGRKLTYRERVDLFPSPQPDNLTDEDCVYLRKSWNGLNDAPCNGYEYYVCETYVIT